MAYFLHQIKKRIAAIIGALGDAGLFLGIVLFGGLGSSWYMVQAGTGLTTQTSGPWVTWSNAARADADPYTRAHFSRDGALPITTDLAATYIARTDGAGGKLQPTCEYAVEGVDLPASWWALSVFDDRGRIIDNPLRRHGFTSETIALRPDGSFTVALARDVRAGNWVPTGGTRRLALVLTVVEPPTSLDGSTAGDALKLPTIRRVTCR